VRIAITSTGKTLDSQVDPRFGRAAFFLIVDAETGKFDSLENDAANAGGGAGISAAKTVADAGAKAVLTGNCGPNAERTLSAAGIQLYTSVGGTASQALELFRSGKLSQASGPNVSSHFGTGL
jgi:predicted Fe-Mo cluster-binding NifX family protein